MGKLASRYAKSLLELSIERGILDKVYADMKLVGRTCRENHELRVVLKSPIIETSRKNSILKEIFGNNVNELSVQFMEIITRQNRELHLEEIATEFETQYKNHKKILTAIVTTTSGLDDELRSKVLELVRNGSDSTVEIIEKTDKSLIGGMIVRIGDKQEDLSISRKLKSLYRTFKENPYTKEF